MRLIASILLLALFVLAQPGGLGLPGGTAAKAQSASDAPRIVELFDEPMPRGWVDVPPEIGPPLAPLTPRRPDFFFNIYNDAFDVVPAAGLDNIRYFATALAELRDQCGRIDSELYSWQVLPYVLSNNIDLFQRMQQGDVGGSELGQLAWLGIMMLGQGQACTYNPSGPVTRDQAQARCDEAAQALSGFGVLPSIDATHDVAQLLSVHACPTPQARHFERKLLEFGRVAHRQIHRPANLPAADTAEGIAYRDILGNCLRRSWDEQDYAWCRCFVGKLYQFDLPRDLVDQLAFDPFVDRDSYIESLRGHVPGFTFLQQCREETQTYISTIRERRQPRPTACLVDTQPHRAGQLCTYQASWGRFTWPRETCEPEISSRQWGSVEMSCQGNAQPAVLGATPRRWKEGAYTRIDYEFEVADDYEVDFPDDASDHMPFTIQFHEREKPGSLKWMTLGRFPPAILQFQWPPNAAQDMAPLINRPFIGCTYNARAGQRVVHYWYGTQNPPMDQINAETAALLTNIGDATTRCPASIDPDRR